MSSPFPIPQLTHPSPSQLHAGPTFAPSPLSQLLLSSSLTSHLPAAGGSGSGTTPNAGNALFPGVSPSYQLPGFTPPSYLTGLVPPPAGAAGFPGAVSGFGGGGPSGGVGVGQLGAWGISPSGGLGLPGAQTEQDGLVRGLGEAEEMLRRMEVVTGEIEGIEKGVFGAASGSGDGSGELGRLEQLHMEYTQLLLNLFNLSQSNLFGALPCTFPPAEPLSAPTTDPAKPPSPSEAAPAAPAPQPTLPDLTKWAEERASLEFSRREALRAGGKAVLDVLKAGAAGR
ncbi:hypothetical protein IAT38_005592 [Cryptococcus sp. DSM 104549]